MAFLSKKDVRFWSLGIYFLFDFRATPNNAPGLLLALYSGVTPGRTQGTIRDAGIRRVLDVCQGRASPTTHTSSPIK